MLVLIIRNDRRQYCGDRMYPDLYIYSISRSIVCQNYNGYHKEWSFRCRITRSTLEFPPAGALAIWECSWAASLSQVLSSPFWGRLADRTGRWTMVASVTLAGLAGILMLVLDRIPAIPTSSFVLSIPVIFLGFAIAGVRLGRKTYLVDSAPDEKRPLYVALNNTIAGVLILICGGLGVLIDILGIQALIFLFATLAFFGAASSWQLPEASQIV